MNDVATVAYSFMQALWAGDLERCFAMLGEDAEWHFQLGMPQAQIGRGRIWPAREGLQRVVYDLFGKFDGGFDVTLLSMIASGDQAAIEYRARATTIAGTPYENFYVTLLRVRDGKVAAVRPYNDTAHMLAAIG